MLPNVVVLGVNWHVVGTGYRVVVGLLKVRAPIITLQVAQPRTHKHPHPDPQALGAAGFALTPYLSIEVSF